MQRLDPAGAAARDFSKFRFGLFPVVLTIPTVGTLLMLFWLNNYLQGQAYRISTLLNLFFYAMDLLCYYRAILTNNSPVCSRPPKQGPLPPWVHEGYRRDRRCDKESEEQWKPPRTSHCHTCGCILRMDHHCVWINQCVGLRNHRAFFLFVSYSFLIALQYLLLSLNYYFWHFQPLGYLLSCLWLAWVGIGTMLVISLGAMGSMQLFFIATNQTQLQLMKSSRPQNPFAPNPQNIYDLGPIFNISDFFDFDPFFWWWPTHKKPLYDGSDYPKVPMVTRDEVMQLSEEERQKIRWDCQYRSLQQAVQAAKRKYQNKIFTFKDRIYRYSDFK